jgi:hypothetical protein
LNRKLLYKTVAFLKSIDCDQPAGASPGHGRLVELERWPVHVAVKLVQTYGAAYCLVLVLAHNMGFVWHRSEETKHICISDESLIIAC